MNSSDRDIDKKMEKDEASAMNRDPITGAPGSHPVGTGLGAAGGAAAGAAAGSIVGPVGTLVGGAVGAVVGGLVGKGAGEAINPTAEETYWHGAYVNEPYYNPQYQYNDYAPAYRLGYQGRSQNTTKSFEESQDVLRSEWERARGESRMTWEEARPASEAAWNRVNGKVGS